DKGGRFRAKGGARPGLIVVAAAARKLGRAVKWIETRSENLVGMTHGRGQVQQVELGATRDGHLVGLRARVLADVGAYPGIATLLPFLTGQMSAGVYAIPAISYEAHCVVTNTTPLAAYRGAGRPEAAARVDRVQLGIGLSVYVEVTAVGIGPEWGAVRIETDGTATVRCGTTSFGQGHETSLAQIAAEQLGLPLESVLVIHSDTDAVERGTGT